ncbi:MAG TPA: hypothetical protein VE913_23300, partial [Longimicrobium sp.]|nr:hypothetical protein [Longimicrobium sp.]
MPPEHTVDLAAVKRALAALRAAELRGADGEGAATADALPPGVRAVPAVALARARARMRQGWIVRSRAALDEADPALTTPGERVAMALESAMLRVFAGLDIRQAVADADVALASSVELDPADRAEGERLHARLVLAAATLHEVDADTAARARDRLAAAADVLEAAGRTDAALAARFTGAEWAFRPTEWVLGFAALAAAAGRADLAGDAHAARAASSASARATCASPARSARPAAAARAAK